MSSDENSAGGAISESFEEDFGAEAACFLLRDFSPSSLDTITARVRGIRDVELLEDLIAAEVALGPRQELLGLLNQRKLLLQENPELARPLDKLRRRSEPREIPEKSFALLDENGEPRDRVTATTKLSRIRRARADGGDNSAGGGST